MKKGILGLLLLWCLSAYAQPSPNLRISANYEGASFYEVVEDLEQRYALHFFFMDHWVDSLEIRAQILDRELEIALAEILKGTDLYAYIATGNRVILTSQFKIWTGSEGSGVARPDEGVARVLALRTPLAEEIDTLSEENQVLRLGESDRPGNRGEATLVGYLRDRESGQPLAGASVFIKNPVMGVVTDAFGYYVITLPRGQHELNFTYIGMRDTRRQIVLQGDAQLDIEMQERIISLQEVSLTSERSAAETVETGTASLRIEEIKAVPTLLGEADVMKIALTLPGVTTVGEAASGFNVRGGNTDQNQVSLDHGIIYNPSHLFGFFSAFNSDVIKSADLHKSGIKARYGGRLSSYFDVAVREGNQKQFSLSGGVGPVTSQLTVEGPLAKDKSAFILGLRSTYSDWLLRLLEDPALNRSTAFFGDGIVRVDHRFDDSNHLSVSAYHSRDAFRLNSDTLFRYNNSLVQVQFRHLFSNVLSARISTGLSNYAYLISNAGRPLSGFDLSYQIDQGNLNFDFDYFPIRNHHITFGLQSVYYRLNPGEIRPNNEQSIVGQIAVDRENGMEMALYLGDEVEVNSRLSLYAGIRLSGFALLGPGKVFGYLPNLPREKVFIADTTTYSRGQVMERYAGPELRLSARLKLSEGFALKASFENHRQYIHMLTNTVSISPTDTWRLSNSYIPPQTGTQVAIGLYRNLPSSGWEFSLESYFKRMNNLLEYKDGADLLVNEVIETEVTQASGRAFGLEAWIRKKTGRLNGWISYTYSRALLRTLSAFPTEQINFGEVFPANFDKPHSLSLISNYKFNRRFSTSLNVSYSTGRPTTLPLTQYPLAGATLPFFTNRNRYRIPDYFRLDFSVNVEGNHKVDKLIHGSWSFSVYNLTGRNNAFSVFSRIQSGSIRTYQLSVFARPIPTVTYHFRFL